MATIWRSSPLSNWQASAACFTPDATWESNWCTALRPPGRNPSGNMGKPKPGENGFDFQIFPSTNPVIIRWYNQPLDNIQWLSSDYHSWSSDTTQLWSTGRPPKKKRPFFPRCFCGQGYPSWQAPPLYSGPNRTLLSSLEAKPWALENLVGYST